MALTPVWSIPVSFFIFGTRPSFRAVLGSIGACLGVIPLYL
jgi:drug/metabolite transporter (DMT)-like permease